MKTTRTLNVALIQQACSKNTDKNLDTLCSKIRLAASQGARLIVLQELHNNLYFCQTEDAQQFDLAEPVPGPSTDTLGSLAAELNIVIVASLFERRAVGLYHNTAVVLETDGRIAGCYRKMHIPDDPGYYEKFYFTPGDLGFEPIDTSVGRLGILVCWDQWYPEAARMMALADAEILIYPTAIGWDPAEDQAEQQRQRDAWMLVQRSHAVSNGIPVITCNRTGHEPHPEVTATGIDFWGTSFVAGHQGEILALAAQDQDEIVTAEIDLSRSEEVRRIWPFLRDRRIDAYDELRLRYRDNAPATGKQIPPQS